MTEQWDPVAYTTALDRLRYWQTVLVEAQAAQDEGLIKEAVRFIEEYGALLAEMMKEKAPDDE